MKHLLLLASIVLGLCSCKKDPPRCITAKTNDFKKGCCDSGANVKEYEFQGETVYTFWPGNCGADMTSEVTDSDCNSIGHLGGITGNTKINGEEFSNAKLKKTIWSN